MTLASAVVKQETDRVMQILREGIDEATTPWRFEGFQTYVDYDIDEDLHRFVIKAFWPKARDWYYFYTLEVPFDTDFSEDNILRMLILDFTLKFRRWRAIEPESNIILGEN